MEKDNPLETLPAWRLLLLGGYTGLVLPLVLLSVALGGILARKRVFERKTCPICGFSYVAGAPECPSCRRKLGDVA